MNVMEEIHLCQRNFRNCVSHVKKYCSKCLHAYCRKSVDTVYTLLEVIIFREEVYFCDSANNVLFPIQLELQKIHYYAFL